MCFSFWLSERNEQRPLPSHSETAQRPQQMKLMGLWLLIVLNPKEPLYIPLSDHCVQLKPQICTLLCYWFRSRAQPFSVECRNVAQRFKISLKRCELKSTLKGKAVSSVWVKHDGSQQTRGHKTDTLRSFFFFFFYPLVSLFFGYTENPAWLVISGSYSTFLPSSKSNPSALVTRLVKPPV